MSNDFEPKLGETYFENRSDNLVRYTPENITNLLPHQIFVFGSNIAGRHGAGAAKQAVKFGAIYGEGVGLFGQTYAIPTKDRNIITLPLYKITKYVNDFIYFASVQTFNEFLVTRIGCGLAGYQDKDIAPLFKDCLKLSNVILPKTFVDILQGNLNEK